jgi:hypothetical protein
MRGVLVQSETMCADVTIGADVAAADTNTTAEASHVFAAAHAAEVASAAKAAAHMAAAAAKTSAVTAAATPVSRHEARAAVANIVIIRFIMTLLFSQIARRRDARTSASHANETSDD